MDKNKKISKSVILLLIFLILLIISIFTYKITVSFLYEDENNINEVYDEILIAKNFIIDWYKEISKDYNYDIKVYYNELRFGNNYYSLTYFNNKIRALYPRGERFITLYYIKQIEFYSDNTKLRCKLSYNENEKYTFTINY